MKILYLYAEVMGYTVATLRALLDLGCELHVVFWDHKRLTPYKMPELKGCYTYSRSQHNLYSLDALASDLDPDITVVSGWQDSLYVSIARRLRKRGKIVVAGVDQQWQNRLRQYGALVLGSLGYFRRLFSHIWIPGVCQYEYARKLGFSRGEIIFDLYAADLVCFEGVHKSRLAMNYNQYPHRFIFVGRYAHVKGLDTLLAAWRLLGSERQDWQLTLAGNGPLYASLSEVSGIQVMNFLQPEQLAVEMANSGCLVMPSRREPWGVVAHEFAAAGLPIILSDAVGSAASFLVPGLNGYVFRRSNPVHLASTMKKIISHSNQELMEMGSASNHLSMRITPVTSARNLLSVSVNLDELN